MQEVKRPCPLCKSDTIIVHRCYNELISDDDYWIMTCIDCEWITFADTRKELIEDYKENYE